MFIKIESKEQLIVELEKRVEGEEVVIHYVCTECGDEQVTDWDIITEDMVEELKQENSLNIGLPCTNCSQYAFSLEWQHINGIETK